MQYAKDLTVHLILQDMRHFQLISTLEKAGFDSDHMVLDIAEVVAGMMGLSAEAITDQWLDTYMGYLDEATEYDMLMPVTKLRVLAEACYDELAGMAAAQAPENEA
jgi:hypothetical protein